MNMDKNFFDMIHFTFNIGSVIVSFIIWTLIAYFIARYAKNIGQDPKLHFVLTFFGHLVGFAVSLILITSKKNENGQNPQNGIFNSRNNGFGNQGFNNQNFGSQGYGSDMQYNTQNSWNSTTGGGHVCPSCGNVQDHGGFCKMCGSQMK